MRRLRDEHAVSAALELVRRGDAVGVSSYRMVFRSKRRPNRRSQVDELVGKKMMPSFDPASLLALVKRKGELQIEPLVCKPEVVRVAPSKTALKSWRRVYEFKSEKAVIGRKEVSNGNCNS
jgi:hypothetical protein